MLNHEPPASVGGLSFKAILKSAVCRLGKPFTQSFLLIFLFFLSGFSKAALVMDSVPPATLSWDDGTRVSVSAIATVLRYESIGFYYYNPDSNDTFNVWEGNFTDQSSETGTPNLLAALPEPLDLSGNPIPLNTSVPLSVATNYEFQGNEAMFIVVENLLDDSLAAGGFNTLPGGQRFFSVEVASGDGQSFFITLVETAVGSRDFTGYLQANTPDSPIQLSAGSELTIEFDNYGDVPDSDTLSAPWFVDASNLERFLASRSVRLSSQPLTVPDPEMFLSKQVMRSTAAIGDFLAYELRLENTGIAPINFADIKDTLPKGFRYQKGSTRLNGTRTVDPVIGEQGRQLNFPVTNINPDETVVIRYVVEVGVNADNEKAINIAQAFSGGVSSNVASAQVLIENPFFNDRAFLMGRVLVGECGDENAAGLEGVRIYMEDGTSIVTDKLGRWHIEGIMPGTHVLQVDEETLGARYTLQTCEDNTRKAGNAASRFVNIQGGTLWRENWYVKRAWHTESNIEQQLSSETVEGEPGLVRVNLNVRLGEHLFEEVLTQITIPEDAQIVTGSTYFNGVKSDDLENKDGVYELQVKPKGYFAKFNLSFELNVNPGVTQERAFNLISESSGLARSGEIYRVKSINRLSVQGISDNENEIVFRPKFASMSVELSEQDKKDIEEALVQLKEQKNLYLHVVGHSDSQKMRYKEGRAFNTNYELSELRARSVANYISSLLDLDMDRITIEGKGAEEPIASNASAEGRAKNRRVSLRFRFTEKVGEPVLTVLEGYSGINGDDDKDEGSLAFVAANKDHVAKNSAGFVNLYDGITFAQEIFSATALLDDSLKAKLFINGREISSGRIGMKMVDPETGLIRYTWIGLELPQVGDHDIELQGVDPFGIVRYRKMVQVRRTGEIKNIVLEDVGENIADGRTPIKIKLKLIDEYSKRITTRSELLIESGSLKPLNVSQQENPLENRNNIVQVDDEGYVRFEPVGSAGTYRVRLSNNAGVSEEIEIPVAPDLREWILVGFAEGSVGYNTLEGNMAVLSEEEDHFYSDGEASFFTRGQIKGEWLLTMAYDSRREKDDSPLMQRIDPQRWYVLYGDDSLRGHDAPSREKLYLRIERADFYTLFGDYDTGLSVTELSRYQRTLTGLKSEWQSRNFAASGFAAQTDQGFIRDDIAGDGTSGLYRLSNKNIIIGSDEIVIEVRDRFTNEIISSQSKIRYIDYSIDYFDGTVYFREPVYAQDENFNPVRIVVKYEVQNNSEDLVAGGRVSTFDRDKKVEFGLSGVQDNTLGAEGDLSGADLTWKPNEKHTIKAELAASRQEDVNANTVNSQAGLAEYSYQSEKFDSNFRIEDQENGFGLGQQAADDNDIKSVDANTRYRINEALSVSGKANRQLQESSQNDRRVFESRLEYQRETWRSYGGLRHSEDNVKNQSYRSQQVVAGGQKSFMDERLSLSLHGESAIEYNENIQYPNLLSLGSDYRINSSISTFAKQDFSWGEERKSQDTRVGVRANPWKGGTVTSDVSRAQDEYGPRLLAHAGLFQTVPISSQWTADFGFDRSQTLQDAQANPAFDPRQPLSQGTSNDDYTAVSGGLGYRDADWQWTNRIEHRHADTDDKWTLISGFQQRLDEIDTIAGRILYFDQEMNTGFSNRSAEIDFSYARRPLNNDWFRLNRIRLIADESEDAFGSLEGHRVINNTHFNFLPSIGHQVSVQYSLRYVKDTIDAEKYIGFTDLVGAEYRYDISTKFDLGLRGSTMASWNSNIRNNAFGMMLGYTPIKDVWVSLGYNFKGFYDSDFDAANTRVQGFVLDFRIKLDQHGAKKLYQNSRNVMADDAVAREGIGG